MKKKYYILTDGQELFDIRLMTLKEEKEANELAEAATDGNIYWIEL